jgi:hypothetical protein
MFEASLAPGFPNGSPTSADSNAAFAQDAHLLTLFRRLGATKNQFTGHLTLSMQTLRECHRNIGISQADMDKLLVPLEQIGRTQVTLRDFVRILHQADPFTKAGSPAEPQEPSPAGAVKNVSSPRVYQYAPHAPPQSAHVQQQRGGPTSPLSGRPQTTDRVQRSRDGMLSPPGTNHAPTYNEGVNLYSSELHRLCDMGPFDQGHSRQAERSRKYSNLPVSHLATLAVRQMNKDQHEKRDSPHRAPAYVALDDIARAARGASPKRDEETESPRRASPPTAFPPRPKVPLVPRCASQAPPRYTNDRAQNVHAFGRAQRGPQAQQQQQQRMASTARNSSTRGVGDDDAAGEDDTEAKRMAETARRPGTSPIRSRSGHRSVSPGAARVPSASRKRQAYSPSSPGVSLVMMTEDSRVLADEPNGVQVDDRTKRTSRAFRRQRLLDAVVFLQCHLRASVSKAHALRSIPAASRIQRAARAFTVRRRLGQLMHHTALRPLLRQAQLQAPRVVHAVYRVAPLPKPTVQSDHAGDSAVPPPLSIQSSMPSPPVRRPQPPTVTIANNKTLLSPPRTQTRSAPKSVSKTDAAPSPRVAKEPVNAAGSPTPVKKALTATDTALMRKSEQVVVRDRMARVVQRFSRLVRAKGHVRILKETVHRALEQREYDESIPVLQAFCRHATTRIGLMGSLRGQLRRRATRVIQLWWRHKLYRLRYLREVGRLRREWDWRARFEAQRACALRCGLWWRGASARRRYKFQLRAVTRKIDNRVNVERQKDAYMVLVGAIKWFIGNRRMHRRREMTAKCSETRIEFERRSGAAIVIQKWARRLVCQTRLAARRARRAAKENTRVQREVVADRAMVLQVFVRTAAARRYVVLPRVTERILRNVTSVQALQRGNATRASLKLDQQREIQLLTLQRRTQFATMLQAVSRAWLSRDKGQRRIAKKFVKKIVESSLNIASLEGFATTTPPPESDPLQRSGSNNTKGQGKTTTGAGKALSANAKASPASPAPKRR